MVNKRSDSVRLQIAIIRALPGFVLPDTCMDLLKILSLCFNRILPSMVLDAPASILQCSRHYVMLVTSSGGVFVW